MIGKHMTDKISYTKVSEVFIEPTTTIDDGYGSLMDDSDELLFANLIPYELSTLYSSDGLVLLDEYGNEIY
jgi:hypothetical protein